MNRNLYTFAKEQLLSGFVLTVGETTVENFTENETPFGAVLEAGDRVEFADTYVLRLARKPSEAE